MFFLYRPREYIIAISPLQEGMVSLLPLPVKQINDTHQTPHNKHQTKQAWWGLLASHRLWKWNKRRKNERMLLYTVFELDLILRILYNDSNWHLVFIVSL